MTFLFATLAGGFTIVTRWFIIAEERFTIADGGFTIATGRFIIAGGLKGVDVFAGWFSTLMERSKLSKS